MTKLYLVAETFPYEGGCAVFGVFSSKELADKVCAEVNRKAFRDAGVSEFTLDELSVNDYGDLI